MPRGASLGVPAGHLSTSNLRVKRACVACTVFERCLVHTHCTVDTQGRLSRETGPTVRCAVQLCFMARGETRPPPRVRGGRRARAPARADGGREVKKYAVLV